MLFSELLKAIPKRWMQIFYFEVWEMGIQGIGHLQLKFGLSRVPKASNT
jgi:hypothetical protein